MTAETPNRSEWPLYGLPGAEYMKDDPDEVIVAWIDDRGSLHEHAEEVRVEEWSARPLCHWLPDADSVLAWIAESAGEEVFEEGSEAFFEASCDPDVVAAFEAALTVFGDAIGSTWRMAHEQIGEITYMVLPDNTFLRQTS